MYGQQELNFEFRAAFNFPKLMDFWKSTQLAHWTFDVDELRAMQMKRVKEAEISRKDLHCFQIACIEMLFNVGKLLQLHFLPRLSGSVYLNRISLTQTPQELDTRLVALTCLYLAAKTEEVGQVKVDFILKGFEMYKLRRKDDVLISDFSVSQEDILDCELEILSVLNFELVIFHPYQSIMTFQETLPQELSSTEIAQPVFDLLNDLYSSDIMFLYPPFVIATAALNLITNDQQKHPEFLSWISKQNIQMTSITTCSKDIHTFMQWLLDLGNQSEAIKVVLAKLC